MATGLDDLLRHLPGDRPEVALLLAKAPLGLVVSALADRYGAGPLVEDAAVREAGPIQAAHETAGWIAAVEPRDESWTCVYVALGEVVELERDLVRQVAIDLSETLPTEAIGFSIHRLASDERPTAEFEAFADGEVSEHLRWQVDGPLEIFESAQRESPPDSNRVPLELASRLFADRGLFVPACCPQSRGPKAWLAVWDLDPSHIQRADLLRLRGSSFFDDETLTLGVPKLDTDDPDDVRGEPAAPTGPERGASPGGLRGWLQRLLPGRG